jgi:UDP-glucuronate 4-epimerase
MSKILVTGSAGFIGFHLTNALLERGDWVVGIDNINDYYEVNLKYGRLSELGITKEAENWYTKIQSNRYQEHQFVRMNLEDREQLYQLFDEEKFDMVCNLAAQAGVRYSLENPHAYINSNIVGFMNILEASRNHKIKHLVYASSSSVYGNSKTMPLSTTDNVDHPISLYAATKKSNELMAYTYSHLFNIPTTGLRFFTVYGPWGRPDMALFLFTKSIIENIPIKVFNNGDMYRDFTFIDDIVEGIIRVLNAPPLKDNHDSREVPYMVYNIGNSKPVRLVDFIKALEKSLGKESIKEYLPMQPGDVYRTEADVTDLVKQTGYRPSTTVEEGVGKFVDWYCKYYCIEGFNSV